MNRSDYTYQINEAQGRDVIVIEDLNLGNKSVTNDMENILRDISKVENIKPLDFVVVYRDSEGYWDGYQVKTKDFISITEDSWQMAVRQIVNKQLALI